MENNNFEKYNKLHDEVMNRLESGKITIEMAREINNFAFDKYLLNSENNYIYSEKVNIKDAFKNLIDKVIHRKSNWESIQINPDNETMKKINDGYKALEKVDQYIKKIITNMYNESDVYDDTKKKESIVTYIKFIPFPNRYYCTKNTKENIIAFHLVRYYALYNSDCIGYLDRFPLKSIDLDNELSKNDQISKLIDDNKIEIVCDENGIIGDLYFEISCKDKNDDKSNIKKDIKT